MKSSPDAGKHTVPRSYVAWRRARIAVQSAAFALFIYLLIGLTAGTVSRPHSIFFDLDPLAGVIAAVGGREIVPAMALGLVTLALAFFLGRAWCSWVCPMGTVLDWAGGRSRKLPGRESVWRTVKYGVLIALLISAAFGTLTLAFLDPITLMYRSIASAVLPLLNWAVTGAEIALYNIGFLQTPLEAFDRFFRAVVMPVDQPVYPVNILIALVFIVVLALNLVRPRFWCRFLCPLGAIIGLASRVSLFRVRVSEAECTSCGRCRRECPMGAIEEEPAVSVNRSECTLCLDCLVKCEADAMAFSRASSFNAGPDPTRRQFLYASGLALAVGGLLRVPSFLRGRRKLLVRPPGATEDSLRQRCLKCNQCVRVCPTGGLQPGLVAEGLDQLWSPTLVSRVGYCDYSCNACGRACPTGAIEPLGLDEKRRFIIGLARIDEDRCIPFAENRDCIVCEEMCPTPEKAIVLDDVSAVNSDGKTVIVRQPRVVRRLCIGCGICEFKCPVEGRSAIIVEPDDVEHGRQNGGGRNTV